MDKQNEMNHPVSEIILLSDGTVYVRERVINLIINDISIEAVTEIINRRDFLTTNSPNCPKCKTNQVQLIDHFHSPALWRCRGCKQTNNRKTTFVFEPEKEDKNVNYA